MSYEPANPNGQAAMAASAPVVIASNQSAVPVSAASLPLPSGAATAANQATAQTSLGNIDTNTAATTTALGAATSVPTGSGVMGWLKGIYTALVGTLVVSGTVTSNVGATNGLALDATATNGTQTTQVIAGTTGGYTPGKLISAATTNATSVKASAGTLGFLTASNVNASPRYLKLYNKASAPTVGTDVPVATFVIPGATTGAGTNIPIPTPGLKFTTGIAFAITSGVADNDTGAVAAAEIVVNYGTI